MDLIDYFSPKSLPDDIIHVITHYLTTPELFDMMLTCRNIYNYIWNHLTTITLYTNTVVEKNNTNKILECMMKHKRVNIENLTIRIPQYSKISNPDCNIYWYINIQTINLITQFKNLNTLTMEILQTDPNIKHEIQYLSQLSNLTNLKLKFDARNTTDTNLIRALQPLRLRILDIQVLRITISDTFLKNISDHPLQTLKLLIPSGIPLNNLEYISHMIQLKELSFGENFIDYQHDNFKYLENLINLERLAVHDIYINNVHFGHIMKLTNCRSLRIKYCQSLTDEALHKISALKLINDLAIEFAKNISTSGFISICQLPLINLVLIGYEGIYDQDLQLLTQIKTLQCLQLSDSPTITNKGLKIIASHPTLCYVTLAFLPNINNDGIISFVTLRTLTKMCVNECPQVTYKGMNQLTIRHINSKSNNLVVEYYK